MLVASLRVRTGVGRGHSLSMKLLLLLAAILGACASSPSKERASPIFPSAPVRKATATVENRPPLLDRTRSWIEVDLARQKVILHEADIVVGEYPASSGVESASDSATPAGLYRVQMKEPGPEETVPGVFVSDIVVFDLGRGNGIHSRPMDADGNLLDPTLGAPTTGGCVRVGESRRVYEFAQVGMQVWIH